MTGWIHGFRSKYPGGAWSSVRVPSKALPSLPTRVVPKSWWEFKMVWFSVKRKMAGLFLPLIKEFGGCWKYQNTIIRAFGGRLKIK